MFNLRRLVCFFALLTAAVGTFLASSAQAEQPFAAGSFKSACVRARQTKRIVLIDFYTTWCGPCKMLDAQTWHDKKTRAWLVKHTVSRKIDAEKQVALATKYHIDAYPTILLLKPNGKEIDRLVGFRDPKTFLLEVGQALAGHNSVWREKAAWNRAQAEWKAKGKNDTTARMEYAESLAEKGLNAEALTEFLWRLDEGNKRDASFYGVRLSFLLSDIKDMDAKYPPALTALKQRRDVARASLENGSATDDIAADFAAYNEYLGQQAETLTVYDRLKTERPFAAAAMFPSITELLLQKKRYAEFVAGTKNIPARVDQEIAYYKADAKDAHLEEAAKRGIMHYTLQACGNFYEALLGTDKTEEADALRDKMLAFHPGAETYAELMRRAIRAGKPGAAQKLKEAAKSALSAADFAKIEKTDL